MTSALELAGRDAAAAILEEFGEALAKARPFRVLLTRPPYRCLGKGRLLVVGQRQESEGLTLLLTYTEFERLPKEAANT